MYGIGSWDGLCLTVLEHTCSLMQRKNLCCLFGETHKTFPARSYYFIRKVVYKITFAFEVYARGCQPKNDIRILPRAPAKKTLIISKGLVNFTLNINLPFEKMSFIWTQHQFH